MSRTPSVSDDEILKAALKIYTTHSANGFSVKKVANEVGLSRAAIIARFNSTQDLKLRAANQLVSSFIASLDDLPKTPSGDNVLEVVRFIGLHFQGRRTGLQYLVGAVNTEEGDEDPELLALETKLHAAMKKTISRVLPILPIGREATIEAFRAHILGTLILWDYRGRGKPSTYLQRRTKEWLQMVGIPYSAMD